MEFGLDLLEPGRRPVRSQIRLCYLVADIAGSKLVADRFKAGADLLSHASSLLAS